MPMQDDSTLDNLCRRLAAAADSLDASGQWPREQLAWCGEAGVYRWFLPAEWDGWGWSAEEVVRGYLKLSQACLTTTFVITQRTGACRRIAASENESLKRRLLPDLAAGRSFATVGISHLTTSRRHLAKPVLEAVETDGGFVLDGYSPWVTGAAHAETIVTGATLADGRQILVAVDTAKPGVGTGPSAQLIGLSSSHTGEVRFTQAFVPQDSLLAGPIENVMMQGIGARTGGLETSTLAVGLAAAAIAFIDEQAQRRAELASPSQGLRSEHRALVADLLSAAAGNAACSTDEIRARANSLALRATQAAIATAKGSGYVRTHAAGRWCREALFFLVWSCPQPVLSANLCELAGLQ